MTTTADTSPVADEQLPPLGYEAPIEPAARPWWWVPVLYFMQAMPLYLVVETIGTTYKSLGIDNLQIAVWTGLAALPWTFKMFWGPLVDLSFTKRKWTIAMQMMLSITFAAV